MSLASVLNSLSDAIFILMICTKRKHLILGFWFASGNNVNIDPIHIYHHKNANIIT